MKSKIYMRSVMHMINAMTSTIIYNACSCYIISTSCCIFVLLFIYDLHVRWDVYAGWQIHYYYKANLTECVGFGATLFRLYKYFTANTESQVTHECVVLAKQTSDLVFQRLCASVYYKIKRRTRRTTRQTSLRHREQDEKFLSTCVT